MTGTAYIAEAAQGQLALLLNKRAAKSEVVHTVDQLLMLVLLTSGSDAQSSKQAVRTAITCPGLP